MSGGMTLEDYYKRNLNAIAKTMKNGEVKGTSYLQRTCRIGYNQACHTIEYGIEKGILTKDGIKEGWLFRLTEKTN